MMTIMKNQKRKVKIDEEEEEDEEVEDKDDEDEVEGEEEMMTKSSTEYNKMRGRGSVAHTSQRLCPP